MFTGLVQDLGRVTYKSKNAEGIRLGIKTKSLFSDIKIDDSVSINGVCQTVTSIEEGLFFVQVVHISLEKTSLGSLNLNDEVNLELALKVGDRLGGHIVQGHVNKKTNITRIEKRGKNYLLSMTLAEEIAPYIVQEGFEFKNESYERQSNGKGEMAHSDLRDKIKRCIYCVDNGRGCNRFVPFFKLKLI